MSAFSCPTCGPVLEVRVHGDWILPELKDASFLVRRPAMEEFSARVTPETKHTIKDQSLLVKYEVMAENYVEETRKCICTKCNEMLSITKPKPPVDPAAKAQAQAAMNAAGFPPPGAKINPGQGLQNMQNNPSAFGRFGQGPNPAAQAGNPAIAQMIDSKFTDQELDALIIEMGEDPLSYPTRQDKLAWFLDRIY